MSTERVDKSWQKKGLKGYSVEAILGTLSHYGVQLNEADFRTLAQESYPLRIASVWLNSWKGKGQFAAFPFAAATVLWKRFLSDRLLPNDFLEKLYALMEALEGLIEGASDAPVEASFKAAEELLERIPKIEGKVDGKFVDEVFAPMHEDDVRTFDNLAEKLTGEGHLDDAERFARLEEALLPDRAGVAMAIIRAADGKKQEAVKILTDAAQDSARGLTARMIAVDGLLHVQAFDEARAHGEKLLEEAVKAEDHHAALGVCGRLAHLYQQAGDKKALEALTARAERIEESHRKAHPHHGH